MYKTFLIVILSFVLSSVFSQEMDSKVIKTYSGPFKSDKPYDLNMIGQQKIGKAEYEYYERPDETRVFNGFFNLSYYNSLFISGSFVEDMKNGEWKIVNVSKENSIVTKWTLTGRFILGKLEGEWRDITEKTTNGKTIKIEECIAHFHNNNFIGKFEYNSKQLSINGNISNAGFLDSTWIVNRIENGFSYKTILKFKKGVPFYILDRDMSTSDIKILEDSTTFVNNFFSKYDSLNQILSINGVIFGYSSYFIRLEQDYSQEISAIYTSLPQSSYPFNSEGGRRYVRDSINQLRIGVNFDFVDGNIIRINDNKAFISINNKLRDWMFFVHTGSIFKFTKGSNANFVYPICKINRLW
ncbi:MAG: hypothetical protein KAY50_10265 [Chitinophagaceae bacterium]|jgi:hypothetical protein|nr:hypothetical protein [Chitinophagaceae bacterium]